MDRRHFTRIPFPAPGEVRQEQLVLSCQLDDLSLKGVLLECPDNTQLNPELPVLLKLTLPNNEPIILEGDIRHQEGEQLGLHITLIDIDSASRLRRIVELNTGDESLLKRELSKLLSDSS
ncbi:Cyclic diguanosine monophosphate-binding protein [Saliniradius amylolyticus]|uniref:Cyclic diguanosine monophosphate-binding protein n=1 Tax=Saliniradius amylolyticus TaxID=2183582 RepID=A0A2S2E1L3_9ALTE|nr:PilZ domain-containing protein [Saliniradius amylolyticus]AWL11412.1 Cyclic diguanosine monophosphate-binding protein [Saliniradius amylolyticus]